MFQRYDGEFLLRKAENGWILSSAPSEGAMYENHVFRNAAELAEWIKDNLDKDPKDRVKGI